MGANIRSAYDNLVLAERDDKLVAYLLNEAPYKSRFFFAAEGQARPCDQCALVCALNLYGAEHPGFAKRLNQAFFIASKKSINQARELNLLLSWQMSFQAAEISLINFADTALINHITNKMRRNKKGRLFLWICLLCVGSVGTPGLAMSGLGPLALACVALTVVSLYKILIWACTPIKKPEALQASAREISDRIE